MENKVKLEDGAHLIRCGEELAKNASSIAAINGDAVYCDDTIHHRERSTSMSSRARDNRRHHHGVIDIAHPSSTNRPLVLPSTTTHSPPSLMIKSCGHTHTLLSWGGASNTHISCECKALRSVRPSRSPPLLAPRPRSSRADRARPTRTGSRPAFAPAGSSRVSRLALNCPAQLLFLRR